MTMKSYEANTCCGQSESTSAWTSKIEQQLAEGREVVADCVQHNPASAAILTMGVGFGVGVLLGLSIGSKSPSRSRTWYDSELAEAYGRKLLDSIVHTVPHSIREHFKG